ncbi:mechanosensitive ion channel family protein [Rhodocytophaga aerolata]|uniref:Mechanosensitive ion channel family protein n=1 Tax=Rhodocytophaga aerolata TaxID=455078 RepID=A0ABT8RG20_9BACT|nr:mechanosensitive ion channel family protein [Rhodocytophaga aerolata]MDO1450088.1 mechanosensitive ion channel family protein [Rhodocytophaga aerolata]
MNETINDAVSKLYHKLTDWVESLILLLPNLLIAIVVFLLLYTAGKLIRKGLAKPLHRFVHSRALVDLGLNIISIAFVALGLFVALSIIGLDKAVTSLLAGVGIVGLALGFAFQDIASNFVSGVLMAISKPIQIGDVIQSNDHFGTVININLRSTIIRTMQGQHVHIPNKDIYNKPIVNYSEEGKRRIDLKCGVSYGDDLEKVKRVTIEAVQTIEHILPNEGVTLFFKEFGDSSINFEIRYWVDFKKQPDYLAALSDGIMRIKKAYDENNIMIPFPIRTLDFGIKGGEKLNEQLQTVLSEKANGKHN